MVFRTLLIQNITLAIIYDTFFFKYLSVSESGVVYIWNLKDLSEGNIILTKIKVEASKSETDPNVSGKKKRHTSILATRLSSVDSDDRVTVIIVYGSINSPHFASVDVTSPREDIVIDATIDIQENGVNDGKGAQLIVLNVFLINYSKSSRAALITTNSVL